MSVTYDRFSPGTPVSSTNKTDYHDQTEKLLKVTLNTINQAKPFDHSFSHIFNVWLYTFVNPSNRVRIRFWNGSKPFNISYGMRGFIWLSYDTAGYRGSWVRNSEAKLPQMKDMQYINVREYRTGNLKLTIQRNWQHRVHKTKENKTKTQHNMCWTFL